MDKVNSDPASLAKNVQSRREQIISWQASDTSRASSRMRIQRRVKFRQEIAFLAACCSSDFDEITRLLQDENVDINTSNVDGLTALHQACIDNKLELVRFLCEHGADLHARDNEGWTPLHATAVGGHTEIAKYLIKRGASLAVANSDGDLPHDVAEKTEMKLVLRSSLADVEESVAKNAEAETMRRDAETWLRDGRYRDVRDPVANAGPLHVAAAKGYQQVLSTLLQCPGAPLEAVDNDGWTALHAAAHWGQSDACRTLVSHGASFEAVTNANQSVFDLADESVKSLLQELKTKQKELMQEQMVKKRPTPVITLKGEELGRSGPAIRRSSVTRLPQSERHDLTLKGAEQEKHPEKLLARSSGPSPLASSESLSSEDDETRLAKAAGRQPALAPSRQSPSPPGFVVTQRPSSPRQAGLGLGRRVEIIPAALSSGAPQPASAPASAPVPAPTAAPPTTAPVPTSSSAVAPVVDGAVAPRSKVRSILTRMESLQETGTGGASSARQQQQQQQQTAGSQRSSVTATVAASGSGSNQQQPQRVKSALGPLTTSASVDVPLVFPKAEPLRQSQEFSDRLRGSGAGSRSTAAAAGALAAERNGARASASPPPQPPSTPPPSTPPPTSTLPAQPTSQSLQLPSQAAGRRVSVIMEKEKTGESETERRRISRHNRATKRLTQGVTPSEVEQAKKLMEARIGGPTAACDAVDTAPAAAPASAPLTMQQPQQPAPTAAAPAVPPSPALTTSAAPEPRPTLLRRPVLERMSEVAPASAAYSSSNSGDAATGGHVFRYRPDSYHGAGGGATANSAAAAPPASAIPAYQPPLTTANSSGRSGSPTDYKLLYERERAHSTRLGDEIVSLRQDIERVQQQLQQLQQQQQQSVRVDQRLSGYEAQDRATLAENEVNRLRTENNKLKADNTSLIRVISRLSSQPSTT